MSKDSKVLAGLDLLKNQKQVKAPLQKIVVEKEVVDETRPNFHMPTAKFKMLKKIALERDITLKELINDALDKQFKEEFKDL